MTETIAYIKESLRDLYPSSEVSSLVRLIMERVCNIQPHHFLFCKDKELPESEKSRIHDIVERLKQMEPIQYILGTADFYSLQFEVDPSVLIPRPETEELVEQVILDNADQKIKILDIGTGSGCIAVTLRKHLKKASVIATDISGGSARDRPPECQTQQHNGHFHPDRYPRPGESGNGHSVYSGRYRQQSALHQGGRKKRHGAERAGLRTTPGSFRPGQRPAALLLAYCPFRKEKTEKKRPSLLRNQCGMRQYGC